MDLNMNLTIDESKQMFQETSMLTGCLKNIVVYSDKPCSVTIYLKECPSTRLLELNNFVGEKLLTVRTPCTDYNGNPYNYQVEEFYLNDVLTVSVQGMPKTQVKIKLRIGD